MTLYAYADRFFDYQQVGALASARAVVPLLVRYFGPRSILDVGCGAGAWVRAWQESGVRHVLGVDAPYVQAGSLLFGAQAFRALDVSRPFALGERFDLVQCVEVAEHIDPAASETLVDNLAAHARVVLFSAAPPGQGGEHHVNERPYQYWRELFEARGFATYDCLRPRISQLERVEPWYRYNLLVFVHREAAARLHPEVASSLLEPHQAIPELAPLAWRLRRWTLARLPEPMVTRLATLKHRLVLQRSRRAAT